MRSMAHKHVRDGIHCLRVPVDVFVILYSGRDSLNRLRENVIMECVEDELVRSYNYSLCIA